MKIDEGISNPFHPLHKLKLEYTEIPFNCDGCKDAGIGLKYSCRHCDFDLHKACAKPFLAITHPFYKNCEFQFFYSPPGQRMRICDACRNDVTGFVYHCRRCDFDLHPCCVNLPRVLDDGEHNLYLCLKVSSFCHQCGDKGSGWSYRSQCKGYNLHVSCVKKLLVESWEARYLNGDKNRVRELQTRIPSLGGTLKNHNGGRGRKAEKYCKIAGGAVRLIVSAVLGDPTSIIGAVVAGILSK
ncbi:hypothetical protein F3Y22_tig00111990pilonHSYRG00010 [Hibiscus syriacus]|uniref:DC1 domain-containing protein n=1 Tax=Hibiscus syriacus TaxID=106335 RepID=A0A6A2YEE1_HIBSY|nr:uncharacterized protein LOC120173891 [Hibiscus syriacus]KAE8671144.1 hypothetical protein F3Y22_tig00111990pilonHSYRG00010 [Hibiscus syriacus]